MISERDRNLTSIVQSVSKLFITESKMTTKFIKIRIDEKTRDAFQKKAKAQGVTMTDLVQDWINNYLEESETEIETNTNTNTNTDDSVLWQRLETLEKKLENSENQPSSVNQETEQKLEQYIQYVDQRIDALERVVINPIKDELKGLTNSWKALFNQVRELEGKINHVQSQLEQLKQNTQQTLSKITKYIKQMTNN